MKKIILIIIVIFSKYSIQAQNLPKLQDTTNQFIIDKALLIDPSGGVIYYKVNELRKNELFTTYLSSTGLGNLDSMVLVSTTRDSILDDENSPAPNLFHDYYKQYFKGILIEGFDYTIDHDGEFVWTSSGFLVEGLNLNVTPEINESTALNYATSYINCESYDWDSTGNIPIGTIVLLAIGNDEVFSANNFKLAWKFTIRGYYPEYNKIIYIAANNGEVLKEISNIHSGDFNHIYYGSKGDLDTHKKTGGWFTSDKWYLHANDNSRNILTTDEDGGFWPWDDGYKGNKYYNEAWNWDDMAYSDGDDHWGNDHWSATSAHYCTQKAWDYYKQTTLNRNGMTGWGKHVRVVADYPFENADYTTEFGNDHLRIGRLEGRYLGTYDIIGHEFTHGVVQNSKPLPYEKISGAINESFADIFGFMVERYVFGYVRNWTIGEDAYTLRNMQDPSIYSQPSYYFGPNWVNLNTCIPNFPAYNDFCGVHSNSGVMNKWFYLLSMGGSQMISGQNRSVGGIGIDKAARIAYYTMINSTNYLPVPNATFDVIRAKSIEAARKLYGICSNEYNQTCAAWYAVNVGTTCVPCHMNNWFNNNNNNSPSLFLNEREPTLLKLIIFPNPANDKISVQLEESNNDLNLNGYQLTILDINSKILINQNYKNLSNANIDISNLSSGVYFVNIITSSWVKTAKFVKN